MVDELVAVDFVPLEPFEEAPLDAEDLLEGVLGEDEVLEEELDELDSDGSEGRGLESVTYQPEPLKMMPAG